MNEHPTNGTSGLGGRLPLLPPDALDEAQRALRDRLQATRARNAEEAGYTAVLPDGRFIGPFNALLRTPHSTRPLPDELNGEATAAFGTNALLALVNLIGQYLNTSALPARFQVPTPSPDPPRQPPPETPTRRRRWQLNPEKNQEREGRQETMPLINIYLRQGTTPEYRRNVSLGIHKAMVDVLKVPQDDQFHVFHEVTPDNFQMQPVVFGLRRSERTMLIQLTFNHRTAEQKAELFQAIVDNLQLFADVPEEDILMAIIETASENWWAAGRVVNPTTGYDERMNDALTGPESTS
jgi:phenylpyruvate tautomerase PptA (4-oxalocrotonate tautomerase family)